MCVHDCISLLSVCMCVASVCVYLSGCLPIHVCVSLLWYDSFLLKDLFGRKEELEQTVKKKGKKQYVADGELGML